VTASMTRETARAIERARNEAAIQRAAHACGQGFALFLMHIASSLTFTGALFALWGWFAVPLGVPTISFFGLYGLIVLLRGLVLPTRLLIKADQTPEQRGMEHFVSMARALTILAIGWIVSLLT
jgi:hypothetical protein